MDKSKVAKDIGLFILVVSSIFVIYGYAGPACGQASADGLTFAALGDLHLAPNSTVANEVHNSTFMSETGSSFESTLEHLLPDTVAGYMESSQQWKNWTLQYVRDPPAWVDTGIHPALQAQLMALQAKLESATGTATAIAYVQDFAASAAGYTVAGWNLVSLNSLTVVQQYLETGNLPLSLCSTFPAQIGQLYHLSFDPSIPSDTRAHLFGQALAVTAFMVLMGGKDGFSAKFGDALDRVGLSDAWPTVKGYLSDIGDSVSAELQRPS